MPPESQAQRQSMRRPGSSDLEARCVVNAAGVSTGEVESVSIEVPDFAVRSSRGIHLVVGSLRHPVGRALDRGDGRHRLGSQSRASTSTSTDIDYLPKADNRLLRKPLSLADIVGVYAGLRG